MRASRLLSILILLQLRGSLTAQALADEFEVSVRTIYRDIDALSAAGVPVYGDRGPGGGFQLLDGYRTRLTGLAPEEAEALLLIGLPREAQAMGVGVASTRARDKLLAALPAAAGAGAVQTASRFHLDTVDWYRSCRPVPFLAQVVRAVFDHRMIAMDYQSWTARREWTVEPHGVVLKAGNWYLVGSARGKIRTFHVADIHALEVGSMAATSRPDFDLAGWWANAMEQFEERLRPGRAIIRASPLGIQRLRVLGSFAGRAIAEAPQPGPDGWTEIALPLESIESAAPMLLGIGPEIEIVSPSALRGAVGDLARQVLERIEGDIHD